MNTPSLAILIFTLLAWASYVPVSKSPRLRRTMWPTILMLGLALIAELGLIFSRPGPEHITGLDIGTLILIGIFVPVYFLALRMPASVLRLQPGQPLPAVSFHTGDGRSISSAEWTRHGPLLLVFYRGFW